MTPTNPFPFPLQGGLEQMQLTPARLFYGYGCSDSDMFHLDLSERLSGNNSRDR